MAFETQNLDKGSIENQWGSPAKAGSLLEELELNTTGVSNTTDSLTNAGLEDPNKNPDIKEIEASETATGSLLEDKTQAKPETEDNNDNKNVVSEIDDNFKSIIDSLVDEGVLNIWENYEVKTVEDFKELIEENIKDKTQAINENIFQETLDQLPAQFQSVIKYGLSGGTDVQSLLESWKNVEQAYNVDISTDAGKEQVVRDFLALSNYGTPEMIEQDIKTWKDLGTLEAKANTYKPKLETYYMEKVAAHENEAKHQQEQEAQYFQQYTNAIGQALGQENLNGLVLDKQTKQYIYENSQPIYRSQLTGQPLDALQAAVEELKFGKGADPIQYAEAILAITQPQIYKEMLKTQLKTELAMTTERKWRKQVQGDISGTNTSLDKNTKQKPKQDNITW